MLDVDPAETAAALRADASAAIAALGEQAAINIPIGSLAFHGSRLGWPASLFAGSSLEGHSGPPPALLTTADDLLISANLFAHAGPAVLAEQSVARSQPAAGPVARLALATMPDLGAGFAHLQRLTRLASPYCQPNMGRTGSTAHVGLDGTVPLGRLIDCLGLLFVAFHYRVVDDLIFSDIGRASISLTLPEGPHARAIRALFRCEVAFGSATNRLQVPLGWLDVPNPGHDGPLWALAEEKLKAAEAQHDDVDFIRRLRHDIAIVISEQRRVPRLKQVAQSQAMSTRSLVRQLAAEGQSFHGLVDQELRQRAVRLINDPALSLRAVSDQLGFPDVSSFGRKFRLWFGNSPGRFRREKM